MLKTLFNIIRKNSRKYEPLIKVNIYREAILNNLQIHKNLYPLLNFIPVLKSNAYGHGLKEIAEILNSTTVPFIMVDSLYEANILKKYSKHNILVLGYTTANQLRNSNLNKISIGITSLDQLEEFSQKIKTPTKFHLKLDTGMHRQGILPAEIPIACSLIDANSKIQLEGLCSHFSDSDGENSSYTEKQITLWNESVQFFLTKYKHLKYTHIANSAGIIFHKKINANTARLGLSLYGINSTNQPAGLIPALEMETVISGIKKIEAGEPLGYNNTFLTTKPTTIATIPVGYYEGIDRRLSNTGFVTINNNPCKILGRVSMNITIIDISSLPNPKINDSVTVINKNPTAPNSIENIARQINTTPHEPLIHIPPHLKRVVC